MQMRWSLFWNGSHKPGVLMRLCEHFLLRNPTSGFIQSLKVLSCDLKRWCKGIVHPKIVIICSPNLLLNLVILLNTTKPNRFEKLLTTIVGGKCIQVWNILRLRKWWQNFLNWNVEFIDLHKVRWPSSLCPHYLSLLSRSLARTLLSQRDEVEMRVGTGGWKGRCWGRWYTGDLG